MHGPWGGEKNKEAGRGGVGDEEGRVVGWFFEFIGRSNLLGNRQKEQFFYKICIDPSGGMWFKRGRYGK
jgi:hypothetical protein